MGTPRRAGAYGPTTSGANGADATRERSFDVLLRCFAGSVGADTATLFARTNGDTRVVATWECDDPEPPVPGLRDGLVDRAFEQQGALVQSAIDGSGYGHTAVAAAFSSDEQVLGAIYAGFDRPSRHPYHQLVWAADSYAGLAALCMSRDVTVAAVLGSAGLDTLTGCLSHRGILEVLDREIRRSQRRGHRLSCCMIGIDGFKEINDRRGRVQGDRVLAAVGAALRSAARRYDAVGRFAGDAFVIVLPELGVRSEQRLAERFQAVVRSTVADATSVAVEASVGVVEWDRESSASRLVEAARVSMRRAKARGRGLVEIQPAADRADGLSELIRDLERERRVGPDR